MKRVLFLVILISSIGISLTAISAQSNPENVEPVKVLTHTDFILLGLSIGGSIFAGIVSSFYVQRNVKKMDTIEIVTNVKNVIKEELEVNLKNLKAENLATTEIPSGKKFENFIKDPKFSKVGVSTTTTLNVMQVSSFESAVKSGNYILLNKELRNDISEVYVSMNLANKMVDLISELTFVIRTTELEQVNFEVIFETQKNSIAEKHRAMIKKITPLMEKLSDLP